MSTQFTCYSCGTLFYSNSYRGKCSTCQQTDRITEQNARDSRNQQANFEAQRIATQEAQWRQERMHQEQLQQNQEIALLNADNAKRTAAAIEKQTQAIFEIAIKPQDAYNKGYNYINASFGVNNPYNLSLEVSEDGDVYGRWEKEPYITPTLTEQFFDGIWDGIDALPKVDIEILWQQAYQAGRQNADGSLGSRFQLDSGLEINSTTIYTGVFDSEFEFELDEETGWLGMKYRPPFEGQYLSAAYKQGVDEVFAELNTPEMMEHRLATEVAEIKSKRYRDQLEAERLRKEKETSELIATVMGALRFMSPIIGIVAAWFLTSGFITFILISVIVAITLSLI